VQLILNDASQAEIDDLIRDIAGNAGFYGDQPDGDVENYRLQPANASQRHQKTSLSQ
jgi:hypothetical protein